MGLFRCEKCNVIENTALCNFWINYDNFTKKRSILCSQCDPKINKWHNRFPREQYNPKIHKDIKNPQ
jgi:primosomal protein N'